MTEQVGTADDYLVRVLTEAGAEITQNTLAHISIDDRNLADEARGLPNLLFYYAASYQRMALRHQQLRIELKEIEARATISIQEANRASNTKMNADEVAARVLLTPLVMDLNRKIAQIEAGKEIVDGVSSALRQKGYSLQLIGSIRGKEDEWLRNSFSQRLEGHPNRDRILDTIASLIPPTR